MTDTALKPGDTVKIEYKSGIYIAEVTEIRPPHKAVARILAVLRHPLQGDLHHGHASAPGFFHVRKALAKNEEALVFLAHTEKFDGDIPGYEPSLKAAYEAHAQELRGRGDEWARQALAALGQAGESYRF